jgi:hypothetical protein
MNSVNVPTRTSTLDNFAWWHRLRRHKVERSDFYRRGWTNGLLSFALHCRTCDFEWHWTVM